MTAGRRTNHLAHLEARLAALERLIRGMAPTTVRRDRGAVVKVSKTSHGWSRWNAVAADGEADSDWVAADQDDVDTYIRRGVVVDVIDTDTALVLVGRGGLPYNAGRTAGERLWLSTSGTGNLVSYASGDPWLDIDPGDARTGTVLDPPLDTSVRADAADSGNTSTTTWTTSTRPDTGGTAYKATFTVSLSEYVEGDEYRFQTGFYCYYSTMTNDPSVAASLWATYQQGKDDDGDTVTSFSGSGYGSYQKHQPTGAGSDSRFFNYGLRHKTVSNTYQYAVIENEHPNAGAATIKVTRSGTTFTVEVTQDLIAPSGLTYKTAYLSAQGNNISSVS